MDKKKKKNIPLGLPELPSHILISYFRNSYAIAKINLS